MNDVAREPWHYLESTAIAARLAVVPEVGLDSEEVSSRRKRYGVNKLPATGAISTLRRLLAQFTQPLMYVLLIAAGVSFLLGETLDAGVILGVVILNGLIGYIQEAKAAQAIDALARLVRTSANVRRAGRQQRIDSEELVPGDVVLLQSGDRVPADLRLFIVRSLQVDESALTGESVPIAKHSTTLGRDTALADRKNLAFAGTLVTHGRAEGVVVATGEATETGRIAHLIDTAIDLSTPLTRKIEHFSRILLGVISVLALLTLGLGLARGGSFVEVFMAAVALAVGAIPEGLPAAVTITLAIGVARMAKRRAIVRNLPAVEALGSTTVICSDKTGTLTENQMTVQSIYAGGRMYRVTGSGYGSGGEILHEGRRIAIDRHAALQQTLCAGLLNNDSEIIRQGPRFVVEGDPTEAALIVAAEKAGLARADTLRANPRLDSIPFESEHQFMATLHEREDEQGRVIYKKGSVERLLERCTLTLSDTADCTPLDPQAVRDAADLMAQEGLRVLAFARRDVAPDHAQLHHDHVRGDLTFLGLQGMSDPPRIEAVTSIRKCRRAGIQVKMITGDHALTAQSIARQLGLEARLPAMTGRELEQIADSELPAIAERTAVFARVAPEQKLRLVRALQARGHIVAMTGDGVNDAPALKQADIGVAMGISGTDVAKGAADILLTDDNFASIEAAVEEGRNVFDNLTKFLVWTLPTNGGEALVLLTALGSGSALPALPVHLLWINLNTAVLLGLTLVFEPKERDLMLRPPRHPAAPILGYPLMMRTGLVSILALVGAFGAFAWEQEMRGKSLAEARTTVVNVIVVIECFYVLNCRSLLHSMFAIGLWSNRWVFAGIAAMLCSQLLFTHTPLMNQLFHTAPLDSASWLYVVGVGAAVWCAVEFEKWLRLRFSERPPNRTI